jgi:hypothetical protein
MSMVSNYMIILMIEHASDAALSNFYVVQTICMFVSCHALNIFEQWLEVMKFLQLVYKSSVHCMSPYIFLSDSHLVCCEIGQHMRTSTYVDLFKSSTGSN